MTPRSFAPSRRTIAWVALALVALHNAEEALAFRTYLPQVATLLPEPLARIAGSLTYPAMLLALAVVTLVAAIVALATSMRPQSAGALWALLVLEAVMGINAVAHVASALLVFGGYGPGVLTAVLLNLPFAIYCFRRARRERWVGKPALIATIPVALMLHGPVLLAGLWLAGRGAH